MTNSRRVCELFVGIVAAIGIASVVGCGGGVDGSQPVSTAVAAPLDTMATDPTGNVGEDSPVVDVRPTASGAVVLRILVQPTGATVGLGNGVSFTVSAAAATNGGTLRYQWTGPRGQIRRATSATYSIPAATAADAGNYVVTVSDSTGSIKSNKVPLSVVSGAWVQVGGRALATGAASQQPSLALCGQPTVAWISASAGRSAGRLSVSRFDGTAWTALGGALNVILGQNAAEPSVDCVDGQPVVAWTEGVGAARGLYVKRWDGRFWVAVASGVALNQNAGSTASMPVLRVTDLPTTDEMRPGIGQLPQYSALAWIEDGQAKAKLWNGIGWQFYIGGSGPASNGVTEIALTLDQESMSTFHPVIAVNVPSTLGRRAVTASTNRGGWASIGAPPSPLIPNGTPLRLGGIGMGADRIGRLPVAAWITGSASYTMDSTRFSSADFTNAQLGLIAPPPTWSIYAPGVTDGNLKATSFDPREFRITCDGDRVPTYGFAISNSGGFSVLRNQCNGWANVAPRATGISLEAASLRMASESDPVVAGVQLVDGQYRLSVWRFTP